MHVLAGLSRVISAEVGVLTSGKVKPASIAIDGWLDHGWRTAREQTGFYELYKSASSADPIVGDVVRSKQPFTKPVRALESIRHDFHRPANVDATLMSFAPSRDGRFRVLVFKRAWGAREFDDEDCALVDLFRAEFEALFSASDRPELSPREREVLALLMDGLPEKLIAARLEISIHTAHTYIKALYRKLGVHSRGELMARARPSPI